MCIGRGRKVESAVDYGGSCYPWFLTVGQYAVVVRRV